MTRQYLNLEQLRLGERLKVDWHTDNMPGEAPSPARAATTGGERRVSRHRAPRRTRCVISINVYKVRDEVHLVCATPIARKDNRH